MNKFLGIIAIVIIAIGGYGISVYNRAVGLEEGIKATWSQVLNQYERRVDLIPNLVSTVKGYAAHEANVLTEITAKRAEVGQIHLTTDDLNNPEKIHAFQQIQGELSGALSRLMAVAENYPDLKANQNFITLQSQLEGTENRIAVARRDYIEKIRLFNSLLRSIPAKWFLGSFNQYQNYDIEETKQIVPIVRF